jgi:hypothetical protein
MKKILIFLPLLIGCGQTYEEYVSDIKKPLVITGTTWENGQPYILVRDSKNKNFALTCSGEYELQKAKIGDTIK